MITCYFGDIGLFLPYTPHFKRWIGAAIAGGASILNAMMQQGTNSEMIAQQRKLLGDQQKFQREMNEDMYSTYRRSLEKAGLNINSELGGFPNTASSVPAGPNLQAPQLDGVSVAQLIQNKPLVEAQADLAHAQAEETRSRIPQNEANTKKIVADTLNALEQNGILHFENETQRQKFQIWQQQQFADIDFKEAQTSNVNIDTRIKDFESQLFEATFDDRKRYYAELVNEIINRQDLQDAEKQQAVANASKAYADASFTRAQEHRLRTLLSDELKKVQAEWYKSDQEGKRVGFSIDYLIAQCGMINKQAEWIDFEKYLKSLGFAGSVIAQILKFTPYGRRK